MPQTFFVSADETTVWNTVASANDGDTINMQATPTPVVWSSPHTLSKAITLQGAGIGQTIILNGLIGQSLFTLNAAPGGGLTTLAYFELRRQGLHSGSLSEQGKPGTFNITGTSDPNGWKYRIHHCKADGMRGELITPSTAIGLIDHNIFINCDYFAYTGCATWDNQQQGYGSWAAPTDAGGYNCTYFEDNYISLIPDKGTDPATGKMYDYGANVVFDGTYGARLVIRHCTFYQGAANSVVSIHGSEARYLGARHCEFYNNVMLFHGSGAVINQRGGTLIVFNNRSKSHSGGAVSIQLTYDRMDNPGSYYGRASGKNPWDANGTAHGVDGNGIPNPYFSGVCDSRTATYAGGASNRILYVSPNPGWTPGTQWAGGFSVTLTGKAPVSDGKQRAAGVDLSRGQVIVDNGVDWIRLRDPTWDKVFTVQQGDAFEIYKLDHGSCQMGRAGTRNPESLLTGAPPTPASHAGQAQYTEACLEWNNLAGAQNIDFSDHEYPNQREGEHFINDFSFPTPNTIPGGAGGNHTYRWEPATAGKAGSEFPDADRATNQMDVTGDGGAAYPHPLAQATTAPQITSPDHTTFNQGQSQTFNVTATGNPSPTVTGGSWTVVSGGPKNNLAFTSGGAATGTATITTSNAAIGVYSIVITASNGIGTAPTQTFTLTVSTPNQNPTIASLDLPLNGGVFTAPATINLQATASDPESSMQKVEFYRDGFLIVSVAATSGSQSIYTAQWTGVASGTYSITAKAFDTSGGVSAASAASVITVNPGTPLQPPSIVVTA